MRKHHKRQILELLQTVKEGQAEGLFAECQDCVESIGAFIENIEGAANPRIAATIALLEEHGELLYKAHNGEIGKKQLRKHMTRMENNIRNELKSDKIELAFLSYNASMSDSIESVYLAAKADPGCDAFWIPIPYFECGADGSLGAMRYEGADCYPSCQCADWREYDIELRRPDAIFMFNPYDSGNLVTRVHSDFYCERLRNLTDMLVYIPYFVSIDNIPEHFCTAAGCVFAHEVVVQSEKVRETYIRIFKKAYGDRFGRPEDKFVALGSPKFDKVINTRREDCILPDAWRGLIGNKKVIFYNTSIATILEDNDQYLKKLSYTFDIFKNRDDAVLWWRPHPLSEATYKSMRPQLLGGYKRITEGYRHEGFGIYDDTQDLHRAIAWGDAYYGDWSSLAALCLATGMPVMLGNGGIIREEGKQGAEPLAMDVFSKDPDDMNGIYDCCYFESKTTCLDAFVSFAANPHTGDAESKLREKRIETVRKLNANADGAAGRAIYNFTKGKILV